MDLPFYLSLPLFILGFGFLVFVHEAGHFIAAKAVGIRTTQFAVGFGQAVLAYRKGLGLRFHGTEKEYEKLAREAFAEQGGDPDKATAAQLYAAIDQKGLGETEYRLNWIPLGGYVKMLGQEDMDPNARSDDPRAYNNKSIGRRTIVISAGVVMNLIFGAIFFIAAFTGGVKFPPNIVGGVLPGSPAATTYATGHDGDPDYLGLRPGDRIIEADGDIVRDLTGIKIAAALGNPGEPVDFVVERPDYDDNAQAAQRLTYAITPQRIAGIAAARGGNLQAIGVEPTFDLLVNSMVTTSEANAAGVRPDMTLVEVGGRPVETFGEFAHLFEASTGRPLAMTFESADGDRVTTELAGRPTLVRENLEQQPHLLGWSPVTFVNPIPDSPAANAGVQPGDLLMSVNGTSWPAREEALGLIREADEVRFVVQRDGQRVELPAIAKSGDGTIGVYVLTAYDRMNARQARPDSPGQSLNLPAGSRIVAVAGQPVDDWSDFQLALQERAAAILASPDDASLKQVAIEVELALPESPIETGSIRLDDANARAILSASWATPQGVYFTPSFEPILADGPIDAIYLGFEYTVRFIQQTYLTLARLAQGSVEVSEMRGPLGIVDVGAQATQEGWTKFLYFLALISVNLAVLNFLPIPITDGGHIVFLLIEKFTGKPPGEKVIQWATLAGLAVIGTVFLYVTFNDIMRLVGFTV